MNSPDVLVQILLGEKFPKAQFSITGVEFLHVPMARRLSLRVPDVLATHAQQQRARFRRSY